MVAALLRLDANIKQYKKTNKYTVAIDRFEKATAMRIDMFLLLPQIVEDPLLWRLCEGYQRKTSVIGKRPFEFPELYTSDQLENVYSAIETRANDPKQYPQMEPIKSIQTKLGKLNDVELNSITAFLTSAAQQVETAEGNLKEPATKNGLNWNQLCRKILDEFSKLVADMKKSSGG